jgi:hypothetical protein
MCSGRIPVILFEYSFITSCLKNIYPFGRDVFRRNLSEVNGHQTPITFTGEKAGQIAPEKSPSL